MYTDEIARKVALELAVKALEKKGSSNYVNDIAADNISVAEKFLDYIKNGTPEKKS